MTEDPAILNAIRTMSGSTFNYLKKEALREAAAAVVCREAGLGFYYPYIGLEVNGDDWRLHGNTMTQFGGALPPSLVDWAMAHSEAFMLVKDEDYDLSLGEDIPEAERARKLVNEFHREILDRAETLVTQIILKHQLRLPEESSDREN